jgi:hypothetical protein
MTDNAIFSWAFALNGEPTHVAESMAIVAETADAVILIGLRDLATLREVGG